MKIVLVGYMGSGKSSIGTILANKLKIDFIDLDEYIVQKEQLTINEIFNLKGEVYFRKIEQVYLKDVLCTDANFVLAVGGGTPCYGINMDLINNYSTSIYLKASIQSISSRLEKWKYNRPLIAHIPIENLPEFIGKHLFERTPFYSKSNFEIITDNKSTEVVSEELLLILRTSLNKH